MATHGYMIEGDPLCHSIALNLTLLPTLSWSTVLPWSFSSLSLSVPVLFQCFHICLWEDIWIPSVLRRHFYRWISGKGKPTPSDSHWLSIVWTNWLSKSFVISFFSESHSVLNAIINSTALIYGSRPFCFLTAFRECLINGLQSRVRRWWERERHATNNLQVDFSK